MSDVVIFGLGRIGARNVNLSKDVPLSHLAAVRMTPGLTLAGLIDPDPAARAAAAALFPETPPDIIVGDASELPLRSGEVVAICTPMQTHEAVLATALKRSPRVVIVEKPLAPNIGAARAMVDAAGAALRVNFHRRFDPRHRRWKERSPRKPHAIIGRYGKGFFNYGSHMIDLLVDWYGPVETVCSIGDATGDPGDPYVSFRCRMRAGFDATILAVEGLGYDLFDLDILGQDGCVEIRAGGAEMRWCEPRPGLYYKGYAHLSEIVPERETGPVAGFLELYQAIADHMANDAPLLGCDGPAALANMAVLESVLKSAAGGGITINPDLL